MTSLKKIQSLVRALFGKRKLDADMNEEMRSHVEMRTEANIQAGMKPEDARLAALRQFGWAETIKEECREQRGVLWIEELAQDIRFGARMLLKSPGFTTVAVLTLALGIGANMVIFTIINGLLFRPVMAKKPGELASVYQFYTLPGKGENWQSFSYPDFRDLRSGAGDVFSELAAVDQGTVGMQNGDLTRIAPVHYVSGNYFKLFGIEPVLGRVMTSEEEDSGAPLAVLSYGFWRQLGADPGIIGRTLKLSRGEVTVIGVMPSGFTGDKLLAPAMFLPIGAREALQSPGDRLNDRANRWLSVVGRLKSGDRPATTKEGLAVLSERFSQPDPGVNLRRTLVCQSLDRFDYHPTRSDFAQVAAPAAALSLGLSLLVLLAACLNLTNMTLARGAARRKEIAVRMALGAGRRRVVRQLFTEGLMLAALGGGTSLLLSFLALQISMRFLPVEISQAAFHFNAPGDWRILLALTALSGLAAVAFAFGPALKLSRMDFNDDLKRHGTDDLGKARGQLLAIGQLALSMALLAAAGLFTRSAMNVLRANPGFQFGSNFYLQINAELVSASDVQKRELARSAIERLSALPGVESASVAMWVPFGNQREIRTVHAGAAQPNQDDKSVNSTYNIVGADYFHTLGIPLVRGREFNRREVDTTNAPAVVIVNQKLAVELWPGQDAIGRALQINAGPPPNRVASVVGVVADIDWSLLDRERPPEIYEPFGQNFPFRWRVHVRVAPGADAAGLKMACRQELRRLDPRIPMVEVETLSAMHRRSMPSLLTQVGSALFGAFGAVALLLSFLGIYGLKAYQVARRTREIGIRIAVGARSRDVVTMILLESAGLALWGLGIGFLVSLAIGKLASGFLYHVSAFDLFVFTLTPLLLLGVVLLACWFPARRAAGIDPMVALRDE